MESGKIDDSSAGLSETGTSSKEDGGGDTGSMRDGTKAGLARPRVHPRRFCPQGVLTVVQRYGVPEKEQQVLRKHTSKRKVEKRFRLS